MTNVTLAQEAAHDTRRSSPGLQRPNRKFGVVVVAEVSGSPSASFLTTLIGKLPTSSRMLVPFAARSETEIAGLLALGSDPLSAILPAILRPTVRERWAIVAGETVVLPERPQEFNGPALWQARALLEKGRTERQSLLIETGDQARDARLEVLAPWVGTWLSELSPARRAVLELLFNDPNTGPAHAATLLSADPKTRISKQAVSQFLRHTDTRHMRALLELVRADATLPRSVETQAT